MKNALRWCAGFAALGLSSSVYSAALHADIDWYAGADLAIVHHEGVRSSETDWMSHKSWVGVDGSAKFTEKHRLLFVVEQEFSVQDSRLHSDSFGAGDHYLGVENSHGVLRLGSFDTALKVTVDEVDLFSDGPGDLEPLLSANAHGGNVIAYHTPEDQPWRVDVALLAGEGG